MARVFAIVLVLVTGTASATLTVTAPVNDGLATSGFIVVAGLSDARTVTINSSGVTRDERVVDGIWAFNDVPIAIGFNAFTIKNDAGETAMLFITRPARIAPRPAQKIRLVWDNDSDEILRTIARSTLDPAPDDAAADHFVIEVKSLVPRVIWRALDGVANFSIVDEDGDDVHSVLFKPLDPDILGRTLADCGNNQLRGHSSVYLGTYARLMRRMENWAPMTKSDSLDIRVQDVSEALGRTALHELGHGVGLVSDDPESPCSWMNGCNGGHTCSTFQALHQGMERFGGGAFIMDAGEETKNAARLGEPAQDGRAAARRPAMFCEFDRQYLRSLHPLEVTGGTQ
jgi:hypothetical protein